MSVIDTLCLAIDVDDNKCIVGRPIATVNLLECNVERQQTRQCVKWYASNYCVEVTSSGVRTLPQLPRYLSEEHTIDTRRHRIGNLCPWSSDKKSDCTLTVVPDDQLT